MSGIEEDPITGLSTKGIVDLVNRKWRNNDNTFRVQLKFEGAKMRFTEIDEEEFQVHNSDNNYQVINQDDKTEDNPF